MKVNPMPKDEIRLMAEVGELPYEKVAAIVRMTEARINTQAKSWVSLHEMAKDLAG